MTVLVRCRGRRTAALYPLSWRAEIPLSGQPAPVRASAMAVADRILAGCFSGKACYINGFGGFSMSMRRLSASLTLVVFRSLITSLITMIAGFSLGLSAVPAAAQTYTDLHDFNASAGDPHTFSEVRLAQGRDGNFYGESQGGGTG